jgi:RNA polymerase sigma-70 factor (ECF subfamily)
MLKVARGDRRAFSELFDRHHRRVAGFAFRFVQDRARAEELAQDIFVKLYQNARGYRPSARFKTYLFRVATNHCLNELRRGEYRVKHVSDSDEGAAEVARRESSPSAEDGAPDRALEGKELERAVGAALANLSDRERAAFTMCRFEGMAYREIADALSASEAAVKSLIHRATLSVARALETFQAPSGARIEGSDA